MSKKGAEAFPELFPGMESFHVDRPPNPTPEQIDKLFSDLISDLDYDAKKLKTLSTKDKLAFIVSQETNEKRVPSPEWLISAFINDIPNQQRYLQTLSISLKTARLEWVERFCTSGGHIILLRELAGLTASHQLYENAYPRPPEQIEEILKCLKSLVDSTPGSQQMLYCAGGVDILVSAIDRFNIKEFEAILYILLPYVFVDHGPALIVDSLKRYAKNYGLRSPYRVFADAVVHAPESTTFFSFLNGLFAARSMHYEERLAFDFDIINSAVIQKLKEIKDEMKQTYGIALPSFINTVETDIADVSVLFKGEPFKLTKSKDIVAQFHDDIKFNAVLCNILSLKRNQEPEYDKVMTYIYHLLQYLRKALQTDTFTRVIGDATRYSQIQEGSPIPPPQASCAGNLFYQHLADTFAYTADRDLPRMDPPISQETKNENELIELREEIAHLRQQLGKKTQNVSEDIQELHHQLCALAQANADSEDFLQIRDAVAHDLEESFAKIVAAHNDEEITRLNESLKRSQVEQLRDYCAVKTSPEELARRKELIKQNVLQKIDAELAKEQNAALTQIRTDLLQPSQPNEISLEHEAVIMMSHGTAKINAYELEKMRIRLEKIVKDDPFLKTGPVHESIIKSALIKALTGIEGTEDILSVLQHQKCTMSVLREGMRFITEPEWELGLISYALQCDLETPQTEIDRQLSEVKTALQVEDQQNLLPVLRTAVSQQSPAIDTSGSIHSIYQLAIGHLKEIGVQSAENPQEQIKQLRAGLTSIANDLDITVEPESNDLVQELHELSLLLVKIKAEGRDIRRRKTQTAVLEKESIEMQKLRTENEKLYASHSRIQELASFIPAEAKGPQYTKLNLSSIVSSNPTDISALLALVNQLGDTPEAKELSKGLQKLLVERESMERNAQSMIKTVQEEREAARSEFSTIRELQAQIIQGMQISGLDGAESEILEPEVEVQATESDLVVFPIHKTRESQFFAGQEVVDAQKIRKLFAITPIEGDKILCEKHQRKYQKLLESTKHDAHFVYDAVLNEKFVVSEQTLRSLLSLPISQEEINRAQAFFGDIKALSPGEQLAVYLSRIPNWRHKAEQMMEHHQFDREITILVQHSQRIRAALIQIESSKELCRILSQTIAICNQLNMNTVFGFAKGFSISDLKQLRTIKTNEKGVTLLHVIAEGFGDISQLQKEIDQLHAGSRFRLIEIDSLMKTAQSLLAGRVRDPFVVSSSRRLLEEIKKVDTLNKEVRQISKDLGVRDELLKPSALIQTILDFATDLNRAIKENRQRVGLSPERKPGANLAKTMQPSAAADEPMKRRGVLQRMMTTLQTADTSQSRDDKGPEAITDYQQAFAKVRKQIK